MIHAYYIGGACATIAAANLILNNITNATLINFGSPRVGNLNFAAYVSNLIPSRWRITHRKDLVPHLPSTFQVLFLFFLNNLMLKSCHIALIRALCIYLEKNISQIGLLSSKGVLVMKTHYAAIDGGGLILRIISIT